MPYQRKTRDYWSIQQYTGNLYGWEEVCATETFREAKQTAKEYRENQPEYPVRIRCKREKITPPPADTAEQGQGIAEFAIIAAAITAALYIIGQVAQTFALHIIP